MKAESCHESNESKEKRILGYKLTLVCAYRRVTVNALEKKLAETVNPVRESRLGDSHRNLVYDLRKKGAGIIDNQMYKYLSDSLGVTENFLRNPNPCDFEDIVEACSSKDAGMEVSNHGNDPKIEQRLLEELNEFGFTGFDRLLSLKKGHGEIASEDD